MKRSVLILLLLPVVFSLSEIRSDAQLWKMRRVEASAGIGPSFFFGDIGGFTKSKNILGFKDLSFMQTRVNFNMSARYRILRDVNARLSLTTGLLKANDQRGSNEGRDMEASVSFFEPTVVGEYYFIKNKSEGSYLFSKGQKGISRLINSMDFYVTAGFGGIMYSVKGNDLLEANSAFKKGGFSPVIPVGAGATMIFSPDFNFGVELAGRYSFTDYLDGYTSQYSSSNDVYYFLTFSVTYKLRTGPNGWPTLRKQ